MKYQKKRKINIIKLLRMITLTLVLTISVLFTFKSTASGLTKDSYVEVNVQYGDSLWAIADAHNGSENIQKVIIEIMEFNNLHKSDIYPGQTLKIPVKN